jgi:hypothetical protein
MEKKNLKEVAQETTTAVVTANNDSFKVYEVNEEVPPIRETTTNDEKILFNALSSPSQKLKDFLGHELNITAIVVTNALVKKDINDKSETAERENKPCIHFFTDMGEHISTVSNGVSRSVKNLLNVGIIPTVENPLKIRVITSDTKNGTMHSFELV